MKEKYPHDCASGAFHLLRRINEVITKDQRSNRISLVSGSLFSFIESFLMLSVTVFRLTVRQARTQCCAAMRTFSHVANIICASARCKQRSNQIFIRAVEIIDIIDSKW